MCAIYYITLKPLLDPRSNPSPNTLNNKYGDYLCSLLLNVFFLNAV